MMKVFLGGTCNGSTWRDDLIKSLKIEFFNPVVPDWTEECYQEELRQRELCDYCLYVITPLMTGVYSIAEVVDDSNKRPEKTVFVILDKDVRKVKNSDGFNSYIDEVPAWFEKAQMKSLQAVAKMVELNGAKVFNDLPSLAEYLNKDVK